MNFLFVIPAKSLPQRSEGRESMVARHFLDARLRGHDVWMQVPVIPAKSLPQRSEGRESSE